MSAATLLVDTSFLGDVLCAEPMVRAAAARWNAPVDFLASPTGFQMLLGHPHLRTVLVYDKRGVDRGIRGLLRLARQLRHQNYERVICSHRSWRTAFLLRLAGIPERVGFDNASGAWLYTQRVPYQPQWHEIERDLALVGATGWERPRIFPTAEEYQRALEWVPKSGFVAVAPGSIWATKRWPAEHYASSIKILVERGERVVLLGGPDDRALADAILELCDECDKGGDGGTRGDGDARVLNLVGETNLRESYAVLERAGCLLTNDSAPMHMGVAAGIPVVALFCSTAPATGFGPRGPEDIVLGVEDLDCRPCGIHGYTRCPQGHFRCGLEIQPEAAVQAVESRLLTRHFGS